jgi:hypothetical protein
VITKNKSAIIAALAVRTAGKCSKGTDTEEVSAETSKEMSHASMEHGIVLTTLKKNACTVTKSVNVKIK